jgi:hypothetical protein
MLIGCCRTRWMVIDRYMVGEWVGFTTEVWKQATISSPSGNISTPLEGSSTSTSTRTAIHTLASTDIRPQPWIQLNGRRGGMTGDVDDGGDGGGGGGGEFWEKWVTRDSECQLSSLEMECTGMVIHRDRSGVIHGIFHNQPILAPHHRSPVPVPYTHRTSFPRDYHHLRTTIHSHQWVNKYLNFVNSFTLHPLSELDTSLDGDVYSDSTFGSLS